MKQSHLTTAAVTEQLPRLIYEMCYFKGKHMPSAFSALIKQNQGTKMKPRKPRSTANCNQHLKQHSN